jgi:predicted anti-sigma-YlaC factor YlaD
MKPQKCEEVVLAAMAVADGEQPILSVDQVEAHLTNCPDCRREVEQLNSLAKLLDGQKRRELSPDLWLSISERLGPSTATPTTARGQNWQPFLLLGLLLVIFKLVEMIPERDFGLMFKLVPLLFVIAVFSYLKENPFKINLELKLEGDR